jgi:hypothetical protein
LVEKYKFEVSSHLNIILYYLPGYNERRIRMKGEIIMKSRKYLAVLFSTMVFLLTMSGCSNDKPLLDEKGKVVSLENKDNPTLVIFFTGDT